MKKNGSKSVIRSHGAHFLRGRNFCSLIRSKSRKENTQKINQNQESKTHTKYRIINQKFLLRLRSTLHPPHPPAGRGVRASHPTKFQPFLKLSTSSLASSTVLKSEKNSQGSLRVYRSTSLCLFRGSTPANQKIKKKLKILKRFKILKILKN